MLESLQRKAQVVPVLSRQAVSLQDPGHLVAHYSKGSFSPAFPGLFGIQSVIITGTGGLPVSSHIFDCEGAFWVRRSLPDGLKVSP